MRYIELANLGDKKIWSYAKSILLLFVILYFSGILIRFLLYTSYVSEDLKDVFLFSEMRSLLGSNLFLTMSLIPFVVLFFVLLFCIRFYHLRPVITLFTVRNKFDWNRFIFSFVLWGAVLSIEIFILIFSGENIQWNFNPKTFGMLAAISFFILPIQTSLEEALFRGYVLQGSISRFKKPILSIVFSSLLFGVMHMENPEVSKLGYIVMVYYILTGVFLAVVSVLDDGLELSMGFHAVNNIFSALIITNKWQVLQTDALWMDYTKPSFGMDAWITLFILYPLLIFVFAKKYHWQDWKDRLFKKVSE
jgi:membrane protease YdiL (CAAX protease family)